MGRGENLGGQKPLPKGPRGKITYIVCLIQKYLSTLKYILILISIFNGPCINLIVVQNIFQDNYHRGEKFLPHPCPTIFPWPQGSLIFSFCCHPPTPPAPCFCVKPVQKWYLYYMVAQNMLHTQEKKQVFTEQNFLFVTDLDLSRF